MTTLPFFAGEGDAGSKLEDAWLSIDFSGVRYRFAVTNLLWRSLLLSGSIVNGFTGNLSTPSVLSGMVGQLNTSFRDFSNGATFPTGFVFVIEGNIASLDLLKCDIVQLMAHGVFCVVVWLVLISNRSSVLIDLASRWSSFSLNSCCVCVSSFPSVTSLATSDLKLDWLNN